MGLVFVLLIAAIVFGVCYLFDKLFTKTFRGTQQHKSGKAVRLSKRYGSIGLIMAVVGLSAVFAALPDGWLLLSGGCLLVLVGIGLIVYYMTFGLFYDDEGFVLTTFGKQSKTYRFCDISSQQLYSSYNNLVIELYLNDGRSVQLQTGMEGVYPFLDKASQKWLEQNGKRAEDCAFYNPENSCWFPAREDS